LGFVIGETPRLPLRFDYRCLQAAVGVCPSRSCHFA
jgi:hypothetical protein